MPGSACKKTKGRKGRPKAGTDALRALFILFALSNLNPALKRQFIKQHGIRDANFPHRVFQHFEVNWTCYSVPRVRGKRVYNDAAMKEAADILTKSGSVWTASELIKVLKERGKLKAGSHSVQLFKKALKQWAKKNHVNICDGLVRGLSYLHANDVPQRVLFAEDWLEELQADPDLLTRIAFVDEVIICRNPHAKSE